LPLVLSVPVVWTALEFFRADFIGGFATRLLGHAQHSFPGGFAWYFLGHSQHDFLHLIQVADLGGAYAVSFLLAAVNALLFEVLYRRGWFPAGCPAPGAAPGRTALLVQALGVLVLLLAACGYGDWRLPPDT